MSGFGDGYRSARWARPIGRRYLLRGSALAAAGGVAVALVGCGGNNNRSGSAANPPANSAASATSAASAATANSAPTAPATSGATTATPASARAAQPRMGGTLRIRGYLGGPLHFDPFPLIANLGVHWYTSFIYEPLLTFKYGPEVKVGSFALNPLLAASWETPDPTTYVFHLRQGVKFHNKPPVNARQLVAQDVLYSFQRRMAKESPYYSAMYSLVKDVEAPDAQTVRVALSEPFAPFLPYLATYFAGIVAPEVEKQFGDYTKAESAIGTGRWLLDSAEPKVKTVFKKNPDYYLKGAPYVDEDQDLVVTDDATALAAFNSQQLDYGGLTLAKSDADSLKQTNPKATVLPSSASGRLATSFGLFLSMRTDKKPFDDVRVRQAIALSVDREAMIGGLFEGAGIQSGPVPPAYDDWALPADKLGDAAKYYKRDVAAARQLLSAAGYPNGFDTEAWTANVAPSWVYDDFDFVSKSMSEAGIRAKLVKMDYGAYAQTVSQGKQDQMGWLTAANLPDVDSPLYRYYFPGQSTNYSDVNDAKLTDMLTAQRRELDADKRKQLVWEIQKYLAEPQYLAFMPWRDAFEVLQPWVKGLGPTAMGDLFPGFEIGAAISNWWIDKG